MQTEVLRIIEGGLMSDKRKILAYSARLADRLEREGDIALSKCIRQKNRRRNAAECGYC